jgi:hypothetical protein
MGGENERKGGLNNNNNKKRRGCHLGIFPPTTGSFKLFLYPSGEFYHRWVVFFFSVKKIIYKLLFFSLVHAPRSVFIFFKGMDDLSLFIP